MLELYKGNDMLDKIMHVFPYKEALRFRDVRIRRLKKEQEDLDKERKKQESADIRARLTAP